MRRSRLLILAIGTACSSGAPPPVPVIPQTAPDAGQAQASAPPPATVALAPPQDAGSPIPLPIVTAEALIGEAATPLSREQPTLVDPASRFRVEVQARVEDARLVLLDEQDAMVPVGGTTEVGETTTRFALTPSEPLRSGSGYSLRLEGASRRETHDTEGRTYLPSVLRLRTTGERPAPAPSRKPKRGKMRRT